MHAVELSSNPMFILYYSSEYIFLDWMRGAEDMGTESLSVGYLPYRNWLPHPVRYNDCPVWPPYLIEWSNSVTLSLQKKKTHWKCLSKPLAYRFFFVNWESKNFLLIFYSGISSIRFIRDILPPLIYKFRVSIAWLKFIVYLSRKHL